MKILSINPGSTSTKLGVYDDETKVCEKTIRHSADELKDFAKVSEQFLFRKELILNVLKEENIAIDFNAVVGRGGIVKPVEAGVYEVNAALKKDLSEGIYGEHASNLGGLIAAEIAQSISGCRAFIADPVVVDELQEVARITGLPMLKRRSLFHALNQKATARRYAKENGKRYEDLNLIIAHLGGGISVGAHQKGRVIDVNNAVDADGPFSPERAGALPTSDLATLCFSGKYTLAEVKKLLNGKGGLMAHLGINEAHVAEQRVKDGDKQAELVMNAMIYNIAKEIGAMAAVLEGKIDAVILTGGIAYNQYVVSNLTPKVAFLAPVVVYAGEDELGALAMGGLRVLRGEATKTYQ
ncbi:MAG: butyrate kinase [Prevotellaceae bacterium]|jgi:butyrate kinase|nr:butyrate kinase [Prevotellaceae bacterium]